MVSDQLGRKKRPRSMYDNVYYPPDSPPSWQYYRCMAFVVKTLEIVFGVLTFIFAALWSGGGERDHLWPLWEHAPVAPAIAVAILSFIALIVSAVFLLILLICVAWLVDRLSTWFCMEFFICILLIIFYIIAAIVSVYYAMLHPHKWTICTCIFAFCTQLAYSLDCGVQFIYWRKSKRRDIYKHSRTPTEHEPTY